MAAVNINRTVKDRLFVWLFGREENKDSILELYNALNHTHYDDPDQLEINTIENVVYLGMHNDVSFLLEGGILNLWEEQSTFNPNMPVRGLMYLAQLYNGYITANNLNLYGRKRLALPVPQYIVFYLGSEDEPDRQELRLSEAFMKRDHPDFESCIEVVATVLNVNEGHNQQLLNACKVLAGYSGLVRVIRTYMEKGLPAREATELAVDYCISNDILSETLRKHKSEVLEMLLTEYDEKKTMELFREEGREEGRYEAQRGNAANMIRDGVLPDEKIAQYTGLKLEEVRELRNSIQK